MGQTLTSHRRFNLLSRLARLLSILGTARVARAYVRASVTPLRLALKRLDNDVRPVPPPPPSPIAWLLLPLYFILFFF